MYVAQKANELVLFGKGKFERYDTDKVKLLNFLRKRNKYRHQFVTINLLHVSTDSLNQYMTLPAVKVTVQREQELFYFEGPITKRGNELSADYSNGHAFSNWLSTTHKPNLR